MIGKLEISLLILTVSVILSMAYSSTENVTLEELVVQFNRMQSKMDAMETKNAGLEREVNQLKTQMSTKDQEILFLKSEITDLKSFRPEKAASYNNAANKMELDSFKKKSGQSTRVLNSEIPSSCDDLLTNGNYADGIYLVKKVDKTSIDAVFCKFNAVNDATEKTIGKVDIKSESVHFYVQRETVLPSDPPETVIPWEKAQLNEGRAIDLVSGVFTAPVAGIYHFEFSGLKGKTGRKLDVDLQVNEKNVGRAFAETSVITSETEVNTASLMASLKLNANDQVRLFKLSGELFDDPSVQFSHFTGWLVEEYL